MDTNTALLELCRSHITLHITTQHICLDRWWVVANERICLVRKDVAYQPLIMIKQYVEHRPTPSNEES